MIATHYRALFSVEREKCLSKRQTGFEIFRYIYVYIQKQVQLIKVKRKDTSFKDTKAKKAMHIIHKTLIC